ncbi:MAG TPA: 3-isopropylmalate dehydratase small subunit [Lentisphaeria bacterium]|nr:MAG: 3-isopropylmalate dehydratase [Lentisphaerae bacterium GWF2_38_69]HBM16553.1 3-isopropylmalate dehydratase small subunit [Lentisphaeria bacterium]
MKRFEGKVLFLDRSDINTDEVIPAKYLTEVSKEALKPHLFEDLKLKGFDPREDLMDKEIVISRKNFGCGSSREHAPWALEVNNINVVIAESFARIFRQNNFNCGMLAIELPTETIESLFKKYSGMDTYAKVDVKKGEISISSGGISEVIQFRLGGFDKALVEAGGWVGFANSKY